MLFAQTIYPAVADGTVLSDETLLPIKTWIEKNTRYRISALPIVIASGNRLKMDLGLSGEQQRRSIAAYLPGQIIINNVVWDASSKTSISYLVHEMVHHAQTLNNAKFPCQQERNREAYSLQNKWLEENGESPLYSPEWIDKISNCPTP